MDFNSRIQRLALSMKGSGVDAVVLTTYPSLRYFFNYAGESFERFCCALISLESLKSAIVLPKLDEAKTKKSPVNSIHPWTDSEGYSDALRGALSELGLGRKNIEVGCEDGISYWQMEALRRKADAEFHSISEKTTRLRLKKDEEEIKSLKSIANVLAKGYKAAQGILRAGITENEAGFQIKKCLSEYEASTVDFCAVQSGRNGAIPHLETTDKKIEKGDSIVVDISCRNEGGYFADFTRTFVVGKPSEKLLDVYSVVKKAQSSATKASGPGVPAEKVDSAARSVIESAGMGEFFFHRTGHGLGLEVHEPPWIKQKNRMKLSRGMFFTVEPGVYLSGKLGVRIEDDLLITDSGTENLTKLSHDLIEL